MLEPSLAAADEAAANLRTLPQVARVVTLSTFIPDDQQQKLTLIDNAAKTLDAGAQPDRRQPAADRRGECRMINSHRRRRSTSSPATAPGRGADAARRLAAAMTTLAKADPAARQRAEPAFVQPLQTALDDLRNLLKAQEVTRDNLPPSWRVSG